MNRKPLCRTSDVALNGIRQYGDVCVVNAGDRFFACQAKCPHEGIALCDGAFDGSVLTCLEHLWQWNLRAGGEPQGFAEQPLTMYEVTVDGDAVYVKA